MPIYEYECKDCADVFEVFQKISDPRVDECPSCGGHQVHKLISRTSFSLKGSGWYKDSYGLKSGSSTKSGGDAPSSDK